MKKQVVFFLMLVAGLLISDLASQDRTVPVRITVDSAGQVQVTPDRLEIVLGDRVQWNITGAPNSLLEIEFALRDGNRGPFGSRNGGDNPSRGRYRTNRGQAIATLQSDREGEFEYSVLVTQQDGSELFLDPVIVVRQSE